MLANDSLLFIDSNKYLDLYRIDKGKKLLAPLGEQIDYIFITQQIVSEVQRNKLLVAADFLRKKFKELKLQTFGLPDHLYGNSIDQRHDILQKMSDVNHRIKNMNAEIDALTLRIMEQISCSEDEVSKALSPIFANAISHSSEELQRARERREMGNPPGKITNPIGDQLTWEQILTHFKDKKRLWIISRDGDYGTVYSGKGFLNRFLHDELCRITSEPEVYLFEDIIEGINHFIDTTGVKAEQRLTPEEVEEIEKEEKALPHLNQSSESVSKMFENIQRLSQPSESVSKMFENIQRLSQPSESVSKMFENMQRLSQPSESVSKMFENIQRLSQPSESVSKMLGEMNPTLPVKYQSSEKEQEKRNKKPLDALSVPEQEEDIAKTDDDEKTE